MRRILQALSLTAVFFFIFKKFAFAHEAYVLTHNEFQTGLMVFATNPFAPLLNPQYIHISAIITLCVAIVYMLNFLWATTTSAAILDKVIKKAYVAGPLVIRAAISASFFYAAFANAILGPEVSLSLVPGGEMIRFLLFVLSIMIFFGFLTELAAAAGLLLFVYMGFIVQWYMITYANYFGELLVLFLFGSRFFSLDVLFFGRKTFFTVLQKYRSLEIPIVRVLYGVALIYAGWSIKFAHQILSIDVYNQYHLINFFHAPADFIAAGAGFSEIVIGTFILLGFAQRLTTGISLVFITLSILYFREMLWPHFMLYGISFSIIINSADQFTLDRYIIPLVRKYILQQKGERKKK